MSHYQLLRKVFALIFVAVFVVGCASKTANTTKKTNEGRYKVAQDYGPEKEIDVSHVKDAVPKVEPKSRGGNRSQYEVLGKNYRVMSSAKGFSEKGGASWYGKKFHGYLTANGEKYDMFAMTAAHKSLPIPTYVRVTNLANDRQVIVRVNDRGPFHKGRIIDLSYAAASKLDMLNDGTAQVYIEAIDPSTWNSKNPAAANNTTSLSKNKLKVVDNLASNNLGNSVAPKLTKPQVAPSRKDVYRDIHYVQVGAYSTGQAAHKVTNQVKDFGAPALISEISSSGRKLFKVILGPMKTRSQTSSLISKLEGLGFSGAHLVDLPK